MDPQPDFKRYFSLDEAVAKLPEVKLCLEQAHGELSRIKDEIVLYKRIANAKERDGDDLDTDDIELLHHKWQAYEQCSEKWAGRIEADGIVLRDLERGLIDFPYQTRHGHVYFLCWHLGEDGLFYFHEANTGYSGRKPISVLPD